MSKRVLIVSNYYPPTIVGGAEVVAHRQAKGLLRAGWEVLVFAGASVDAFRGAGGGLTRDCFEGVDVVRVPRMNGDPAKDLLSLGPSEAFARVLRDFDPDVAHVHNLSGLGPNLLNIAARSRAKTVVTLHDAWGFCFKAVLLRNDLSACPDHDACHECMPRILTKDGRAPVRLRRDYVMSCLRQADAFISPSRWLGGSYATAGLAPERITAFSSGIDLASIEPRRRAATDKVRFVCCAYLGEHKGVLTLVEALGRLWSDENLRGRWAMQIAGHGHLESVLRARIAALGLDSAVTMLGHVPRQAMLERQREADVVVLPSIGPENEPVSLLEGLASGAALIASALGGNVDIVEDGVNGLTFPARDAHALAEAMKKIIEHPELLESFSAANLARRSRYDEAEALRRIVEVYEAPPPPDLEPEVVIECGYGSPSAKTFSSVEAAPSEIGGRRLRFIWWRWPQPVPVIATWAWAGFLRTLRARRRLRRERPLWVGRVFDAQRAAERAQKG